MLKCFRKQKRNLIHFFQKNEIMKEHWSDRILDYLILKGFSFPINILSKSKNKILKCILFLPAGTIMAILMIASIPLFLFLLFTSLTNDFINNKDF